MDTCQNDLEPLRFGVIFLICHGDFVVGFDGICIILKHTYIEKTYTSLFLKYSIYMCVCVTATSSIYVQMMLHVMLFQATCPDVQWESTSRPTVYIHQKVFLFLN